MFGTDIAPALYFSNAAKPLGGGLDQQIETFRREHPDTNLVIIDTLQKVRESGNEKCSYASDYEIISKLKSLAEKLRICLRRWGADSAKGISHRENCYVGHFRQRPAGPTAVSVA